jgi:anti-anti-sigma factor
MELKITKLENGILLAVLTGRLDLQGTLAIENPFTFNAASSDQHVLVDMSGIDFVASIGMRMLVKNAKAIDSRGFKMGLVSPQPLVAEAMLISAIDTIIPIYDDLESATADLLAA